MESLAKNPLKELLSIAETFPKRTQNLAHVVIDNPGFALWTASAHPNVHHYGKGQLAQHTLEVVELSLMNNEYFTAMNKGVDPELLFLAALYHDFGKLKDYAPDAPKQGEFGAYEMWHSTEHKDRIYHITTSALEWSKAFNSHPTSQLFENGAHDEVLHAILAHHGRYEWKSPALPRTRMAWLLHLSDCMSARVDDVVKEKPSWTKEKF